MSEQVGPTTMSEQEALARRVFEDGFNHGRLSVVDEVATDDYRDHDPQAPDRDLRGPDAARAPIQVHRAATTVDRRLHGR